MTGSGASLRREVVYYSVAALFYLAPRLLYSLHVDGLDRFRHQPSTLIVVNHKRDLDSVILPATLFFGGTRPRRPLWFAGREDMFVRGFLAMYTVVPLWLRRLLYEIDLTSVLGVLRVLPVRRFPERTMAEALREVLQVYGDRPLAEVLIPEEVSVLASSVRPGTSVSAALSWRYRDVWQRPARLSAFTPAWTSRVRARQRAAVAAQMQRLADLLDRGGILYMAPEGVISPDGRLQVFRSGLRRILTLVRSPIRLQPVGIAYDFMRPGPLRVFIAVGEAMGAAGNPSAVAQRARAALADLHVMTRSQIASQVLWEHVRDGQAVMDVRAFAEAVVAAAVRWRAEGLRVDPLLIGPHGTAHVTPWLAFTERRQWVTRHGTEMRVDVRRLEDAPVTHWQNPVRYCVNEVRSVREAVREAGCEVLHRARAAGRF